MLDAYAIVFLVCLFLTIVEYRVNSLRIKLLLYILLLMECITVLMIFTDSRQGLGKFPKIPITILILFLSFFTFRNLTLFNEAKIKYEFKNSFMSFIGKYSVILGILLLFSSLMVEYFFLDGRIGNNLTILLSSSFFLIIFNKIPHNFSDEKHFFLFFLFLLIFFYPFLTVLYKFNTDTFGETSPEFLRDEIVFSFLGKPLVNILSILGYNVWASGDMIYYIDTTLGHSSSVSISKGCAGFHSMVIFFCGFVSYTTAYVSRPLDQTILLVILGIFISYISNLIRMSIIILSGHYWGHDALAWSHANIGWLIFTLWNFIFWMFVIRFVDNFEYE